jgi:uncharacterized protein (DUF3820 family)
MLTDQDIMPYGKHKGKEMANVPAAYLLWLYENDKCTDEVREYISENIEVLKMEIDKNRSY